MILSVIVPVYNVEAYLAGCLDSLLACDLTDCEIILSFRDSQDRSKEICDQYCSKFSFVRLISQEGTGLSNARNCAMRIACGDYLLFVDSDDRVDSAVLGELIRRIREGSINADLVVTDFYRVVFPAQKLEPIFQIGETTQDQYDMRFLPHMLRRRQCFGMFGGTSIAAAFWKKTICPFWRIRSAKTSILRRRCFCRNRRSCFPTAPFIATA